MTINGCLRYSYIKVVYNLYFSLYGIKAIVDFFLCLLFCIKDIY